MSLKEEDMDYIDTSQSCSDPPSSSLKSHNWRNRERHKIKFPHFRRQMLKKKSSEPEHKQQAEQDWSRFRLWRKQRPFWGALLLIVAGILVLWAPASLFSLLYVSGSPIWGGITIGSLLILMGLLQLIAPSQALVTGSVGVLLSLLSLPIAFGGMGIGVLLGLIGGALGISWRPEYIELPRYYKRPFLSLPGRLFARGARRLRTAQSLRQSVSTETDESIQRSVEDMAGNAGEMMTATIGRTSRRIYWSVLAGSLLVLAGMVSMIAHGAMAMAVVTADPMDMSDIEATASKLTITDFTVSTDIINGIPVIVVKEDLQARNLDITIPVNLPRLGVITFHLKADEATIDGAITRLVPGRRTVADLHAPFILIESQTYEGVSITITRDN